MKVKDFHQMVGHITRPSKSTDPTQVEKDLAQRQLEKYAVQPDSRGAWKNFVAQNKAKEVAALKQKKLDTNLNPNAIDALNKFEDFPHIEDNITILKNNINAKPIQNIEHPNQVSFDPTTKLFSNKSRTIAYQNYDDADNYNKKMGFKKTKYYPDQATPEQVGALATKFEKHRQMTGSDGRYDKQKAIIKKKKLSLALGTLPKLQFSAPVKLPSQFIPDPEIERAERNFNKLVRENEEAKIKDNNSGIAGLLGGVL